MADEVKVEAAVAAEAPAEGAPKENRAPRGDRRPHGKDGKGPRRDGKRPDRRD